MKYSTIGELVKALEAALEPVIGVKIDKQNSVSDVVGKAIIDAEILDYPLCVDGCRVSVDTTHFDKIEFINLRPHYKTDKRKYDSVGDRLDSVTVELLIDIPADFEPGNLSQKLSYDLAVQNKARLEQEIAELYQEIETHKKAVGDLEQVMKLEKYD